jgi:uncharacterized membrane protein YqjE
VAGPESEQPRDAARAGFFSDAVEMLAAAWAYLRARFELASIEGREAGVHWLKALALLLGGIVVVVFGYFFFCFAVIFVLAIAFGGSMGAWIGVTFVAALVHFLLGAGLLWKVWGLVREPLFPVTIEEFKKDQAWLDAKTAKRN